MPAGDSGSFTVTGTIENPFPTDATIPMENTANLTSNESAPVSATTSVMVDTPRPILSVQKSAPTATIAENTNVTYTIDYANTGDITATGVTLTDVIPTGLTFVSATGGGTESGGSINADSNAAFCVSPPANLVIDKQVDNLTASPGDTLIYTLLFSNTGQTNATGAQITDTLPTGVSFVSATLNGGAAAPASVSGQDYTFNVNSNDTATVGQVTGGQGGSLVITCTVDSPLDAGITEVENSASLVSDQTVDVIDTASTAILTPELSVSQTADLTLVGPGDTVTYTFTIINSGPADATNVTLNDVLPVTGYYTYVPGSTTLNGAPAADNVAGGTLDFNIGTLAAGETAVITIQMTGGAAATFPAVQTNLDSTATVTNTETSGSVTSNTVTVTVNPLPNLTITKSFNPAGPYSAGDTITCEITVSNIGGADALGVTVTDVIPAFTDYKNGTLVYNGSGQTDVPGDDTGSYDGSGDRAVFQVGTLTPGTSRDMSFDIQVENPMPSGATPLSNTAQVTASNAAAKSDTITDSITAAPDLTLTKSGPGSSPYPAATATASSSGTTVQVDDVTPFLVNQYILVAGNDAQITAISGGTLTVDTALTVTNGDDVTGSISYSIQYGNSGTANAIGTTLVDTLPTAAVYVDSSGGGVYAAGPNTVTWNIGTLAVGDSGVVKVFIFPGAAGNATNSATITATGATPASDTVTTGVGGLRISKSTSTPSIQSGTAATYAIEIRNTAPSTATGIVVTDTLAPGFTYSDTVSITGGSRTGISDPTVGDQVPSWGTFSLNSNETMTITFRANTGANIEGTFDNELSVTSTDTSAGNFDPLLTTAEDVTVSPGASPPPTGSLASAGDISEGCTATLNWTAVNATTGTLNPGGISVPVAGGSGSINVTPTSTTVYTLQLTGPGGSVSYNATVNVDPAPSITAFTVSPSSINAGDAVTFSATFTGGADEITPGNYDIDSGGTVILDPGPDATTTYVLTVTAPCGSASRATAKATVTVIENRLDALKSVSDVNGGNLRPGDVLLYTITIISSNDEDLGGVTFSDAIPANTSYVDGSAVGPADGTVNVAGGVVQVTGITVPARGLVMIMFKVKLDDPLAAGVTGIYNQGVVHYDKNGDGENDSEALTDGDTVVSGEQETILPVTQGPNLSDTVKSGELVVDNNNDGVVSPGDTIRYRIDIVNSGDEDAIGVTFHDPIPIDTDFVAGSITSSKGAASYDANTNQVQWSGDVAMGETVSIGFDVIVHTGIRVGTVISNQGFVSYDSNGDGANDATLATDGDLSLPGRQTTDFTVGGISSVPAVKTAVPLSGGAATFGDELRYEIVISNPTGFILYGLEFIDTIPTNTTLVEGSVSIPAGAQLVSQSPTLRVTGINLEPFSQVTISFNVRIAEELASGVDSIVNQGTVLFDSDGDGSNDMWTLTDWNSALPGQQPTVTTITCPVVEITDVSVLDTVECEGEIEYLVTYTNVSAATARDVVITSVYDFKVEYQSASVQPDQGTNNTWTIGTLAPGQSGNIRIKVKVVYRLPFLHIVEHAVVLTTNCDTRQAGARTQVLGCGPR